MDWSFSYVVHVEKWFVLTISEMLAWISIVMWAFLVTFSKTIAFGKAGGDSDNEDVRGYGHN